MQKKLYCKTLVIGIIVLFIGVGVYPSSGITIIEKPIMPTTRGNTLYVGGDGPGNYSSIQDAIDDAVDGDTVFVYDDSSPYYENVFVDKSINLMGESRDTTIIDSGEIGNVVYISAEWVNISGFLIKNGGSYYGEEYAGITIKTNFSTISGNDIISNNHIGINLRYSSYNIITGNNISWNNWEGIFLWNSSNNTVTANTISSNNFDGINLWDDCDSNIITGNIITANGEEGLDIHSSNNVITGNTITSSHSDGIVLRGDSNTITGNTISNNEHGIYLDYSSSNTILKNNFLDNERDAYFFVSSNNQWKQNYWNRPRILPKLIPGKMIFRCPLGIFYIPWFNIDWRPALRPYDIEKINLLEEVK